MSFSIKISKKFNAVICQMKSFLSDIYQNNAIMKNMKKQKKGHIK